MKHYFLLVLAVFASTFALGTACPTGYTYEYALTVPAQSQLTGSLTNYPLLFLGNSALAGTTSGGYSQSATGLDVVFCTSVSGGSLVPFELVPGTYNSTTGAGEWWVQFPSISQSAASSLYVFIGKSSATDQSCGASGLNNCGSTLWSGFLQVHHWGTSSTLTLTDSTGTCTATNHSATATSGPWGVGGAAAFASASSQYVDTGCQSSTSTPSVMVAAYDINNSAFSRILSNYSTTTGYEYILSNQAGSGGNCTTSINCAYWSQGSNGYGNITGTVPNSPYSQWVYYGASTTSSSCTLYMNSTTVACAGTYTAPGTIAVNMMIGSKGAAPSGTWNGYIGETEIYNGTISANWHALNYKCWLTPSSCSTLSTVSAAIGSTLIQ